MMELSTAAHQLGVRSAPLFFRFVRWIAEDCRQRNIRKLYFLTREGIFFHQVFTLLPRHYVEGISHELLEISRLSTFLPSLDIYNPKEWERFLSQYKDSTVSALIHSLQLSEETVTPYLYRHGLSMDSVLSDCQQQSKACFTDPSFLEYIEQEGMTAQKILTDYLRQKGITNQNERFAIVDIGWRGTIQDNLCYIYPHSEIIGYYFGLIPFLNAQPRNAAKLGFLNSFLSAGPYLKSHTQLEMICSAPVGSVIGYMVCDGQVIACTENDPFDEVCFHEYAAHFQAGILSQAAQAIEEKGKATYNLRRILGPLTIWPDLNLVKGFSGFCYSERFGLGAIVDQQFRFCWETFVKNLLSAPNIIAGLRQALNYTQWPQGFLRYHHLYVLVPVYNLLLNLICRRDEREKICDLILK